MGVRTSEMSCFTLQIIIRNHKTSFKKFQKKVKSRRLVFLNIFCPVLTSSQGSSKYLCCKVGLYQTSRPVRKSVKFSKSRLSRNRTFYFPDAGLLTLFKVEEKENQKKKIHNFFFKIFFCLFSNAS